MAFTWNDQFVLRRTVEEPTSQCHQIFVYAKRSEDIREPEHNAFNSAPYLAGMELFKAFPLTPPRHWDVSLAGQPGMVDMSVFQLRSIT